ncbi:hypothetical protein CCU68_33335 [Pseudomonas gingeri NCPPB 3146 = LMG 5327]|uniref:Uncharacterized protein n=2 Tax=Pseudomonas gingeri TaxID=117681 RepID=A0ABX4XTW9_9PSED|nr:hypothetical protein [Pseudomonas gingeri]NWE29693.1 hypothetical protein [Pseudomonas gingeri]NWE46953.1 hypothetical protein [Pseudomonas gingeri]NWE69872.1 hypothetical protein [Pseudomonas gingeri]NWE98241.1 hypothetical protein [Pseudomonas gingeri]PNQ88263.1 hypothetical protein CCU68_33335 [Pseudomonas gingeri NCPPB 3146 = LMG 5327]
MAIVKVGVVISGDFLGWSITIDDDRKGGTGGYYIYLSKVGESGFDYWFEHEYELKAQLEDYEVSWSE